MLYFNTKKMIQKFIIHYSINHKDINSILKEAIDEKQFQGLSLVDVFSGLILSSFSYDDKVDMHEISKNHVSTINAMVKTLTSLSCDVQKELEDIIFINSDAINMFFVFKGQEERLFFIHIFCHGKSINVAKLRTKAYDLIERLENIK